MMRHLSFLILMLCSLLATDMAFAAAPTNADDCDRVTTISRPQPNESKFEMGRCAAIYGAKYGGGPFKDYDFTGKVVSCIEGTIRDTTVNTMDVLSNHFSWLTAVLSTLIIIFHGIRISLGERELLKRTSTLVIKLAFVSVFMGLLPEIVGWVFDALHELLNLVVGERTPWQQIDRFIGKLFGFGPSISMLNGLIGLVGASVFSSNIGYSLFFFGLLGIWNLLIFIMQLIYTYCLSVMTIGFLLVLSPVMIPLALFFYTERYFKKWCDLIVSAILTPVLLFAFVWMFLNIFDILIGNIFSILGGNDFREYWRLNTSLCSWTMPSDPNTNAMMSNLRPDGVNPCINRTVTAPVQTNINPLARNSFDACPIRLATMNFGVNEVTIVQQLSFAFITLWIFASLMRSMVTIIPEVAASISSIVSTKIDFGAQSQLIGKMKQGSSALEKKIQGMNSPENGGGAGGGGFQQQMQNMLGRRD